MSYWLDPETWTPVIEKLGLFPEDWFPQEWGSGFIHWTGISLGCFVLHANRTEFLAAIDRYVARLSPQEVAHRKQLFAGYKEARQFFLDLFDWLNDYIGNPTTPASIAKYVRKYALGCSTMLLELTDAVPQAIRERFRQAKADYTAWEATNIPLNALVENVELTANGVKITYEFVLPEGTYDDMARRAARSQSKD